MRRDKEPAFIVHTEERIILCHGLHRKYVQPGSPDLSGIECIGKICLIYDRSSAEIQKNGRRFHFPKSVCVHDIFRVLIERGVDGENIRLGEQSVKIHLPVSFLSRSA